ncbi:hypothetical protein [Orlajensenia leifsoniae]|nr:hypothetical protein [Leifsonia flava]
MPEFLMWGVAIVILGGSLVVTVIAAVRVWRRDDDPTDGGPTDRD